MSFLKRQSTKFAIIFLLSALLYNQNCTAQSPCDTESSVTAEACGSMISPSGSLWDSTGQYMDTIPNFAGCDSVITYNLTILELPDIDAGVSRTICEGMSVELTGWGGFPYVWDNDVINGQVVMPSSTITYHVTGSDLNGCSNTDSIIITVLGAHYSHDTIVGVNGEEFIINGENRSLSGIYTDKYINQVGCDSTIVTTLINNGYPIISNDIGLFVDTIAYSITSGISLSVCLFAEDPDGDEIDYCCNSEPNENKCGPNNWVSCPTN